jgi:hypothetical protein
LNVDVDTVPAAELTVGTANTTNVPAKVMAARALPFLKFILLPNRSVAPHDARFFDYFSNVR